MVTRSKKPHPAWVLGMLAMIVLGTSLTTDAATDWMINEDYKQLDARGATDFDILFRGNVAGQITAGGHSIVTNPFADPDVRIADDGMGNTVATFYGTNKVPADPNAKRHIGLFGTGQKPAVLFKCWSFDTAPKRVPVPKSNFAMLYDPDTSVATVTVENTSEDTVTFDEVGFLVSPVMLPIEDLTRGALPPAAFNPVAAMDHEYLPGQSDTFEIPGVSMSDSIVTYGTVFFSGASAGNDYDDVGGEWAQMRVSAHLVPEPATGTLLMLGMLGLCRRRRCRSSTTPPRRRAPRTGRALSLLLAVGAIVTMIGLGPQRARGDAFVLPLEPGKTNEGPVVKMKVDVGGGKTEEIGVLIDTGDQVTKDGGFVVNNTGTNDVASRLGMSGGTPSGVTGAGNKNVPASSGVPLPNTPELSNAPSTPQGQAAAAPSIPNKAMTTPLPKEIDAVIGSQWLSDYNYGRTDGYFWLARKDQGVKGQVDALTIANFLAGTSLPVGPDGRPTKKKEKNIGATPPHVPTPPAGLYCMDGGYNIEVHLADPMGGAGDGSFIIKTAFTRTCISESMAVSLGIDIPSLPLDWITLNFDNEEMVPTATLMVDIFNDGDPDRPLFELPVGILPTTLNPYGENFLGSDVLNQFYFMEVETADSGETGTFRAAVPEPATMALLTLGAIVLHSRRRRHRSC